MTDQVAIFTANMVFVLVYLHWIELGIYGFLKESD